MIRKCEKCGYTLETVCKCRNKTKDVHPPKFSLADKYAKYRRIAKNK